MVFRLVFQVLQLVHSKAVSLGVRHDLFGRFAREVDGRFVDAHGVLSPAGVDAGIFGDESDNVQGDVSEIVDGPEARADGDWASVLEPLDFEIGVLDGLQFAFEMGVLALAQPFLRFGFGEEARADRDGLVDVFAALVAGSVF